MQRHYPQKLERGYERARAATSFLSGFLYIKQCWNTVAGNKNEAFAVYNDTDILLPESKMMPCLIYFANC
jgi:hypothetical protein